MVFSPDGRYLYTTDNGVLWMTETGQGGNTVSIVDTRSQTLSGTIDLGKYRRPHGIEVDSKTGNLLVTTELPRMLLLVDPRTRKVVKEPASSAGGRGRGVAPAAIAAQGAPLGWVAYALPAR